MPVNILLKADGSITVVELHKSNIVDEFADDITYRRLAKVSIEHENILG